jgi:hypothetical protein
VYQIRIAANVFCAMSLLACSAQRPVQEDSVANIAQSEPAVQEPKDSKVVAATPKAKTALTPAPTAAPAIPSDVSAFVEKRDNCDHFRGEEAYDAERGAFLKKALEESCAGTDAELKSLRNHYKTNITAIKALKKYEDTIEVAP